MLKFLPSEFFNFEFLRVLGTAPTHGCDVGECIDAVSTLKVNDGENWYRIWFQAGQKAEIAAEKAKISGDRTGARWAYLRASNYLRSSELMLRKPYLDEDPRRFNLIARSVDNFQKALALFDTHVEILEIPFGTDGTSLPAYLYLPSKGPEGDVGGKIPVLVQIQGFDTTQEEFYHFTVAGALPRGYAVLTFDAPGQGMVVRRAKNRLYLRGDYEVVLKAVLDALWTYPTLLPACKQLDLDRVAISGNSMGAYFALRGAAFDDRVRACIASDGFYDLAGEARKRIPSWFRYLNHKIINSIMGLALHFSSFQTRWEMSQGIFAFGASSPSDAVDKMQAFTLEMPDGRSMLTDITCPTLVTDATDTVFAIDAQRIYDNLSKLEDGHSKVLWRPVGVGQGSLQAKVAAFSHMHATIFGWLDSVFNIAHPPLGSARL